MRSAFYRKLSVVVRAGLLACAAAARADVITLGTLLDEMTEPERLTRLPEHPYRLLHASSYDRLALQPDTPNWFANTDWSNYLRSEVVDGRTEYVLMEAEGPGAVVRFWATVMGSGDTLRIYVDHAATPLVQGTLTEIVGRGAWVASPLSFVAPAIAGTGTGHNLYLPIPFERHCKITVSTPSFRLYYNIDYRVYDAGTEVETFTADALSRYSAEYSRTQAALAAGHPSVSATSGCARIEGRLEWGGHQKSVTLGGPSAVRLLRFKLSAPDLPQALRSTHLEIDFDGEPRAVHVPIGDFFCTGYTVTNSSTWFAEADAGGGLRSYWAMPFNGRATVRLVNHGRQSVDVLQGEVWTAPYAWGAQSMHFHAAWRDYPFEDTVAWRGEDLNYVTLSGCGRLVGDTLSVFNDASAVPHAYANWWGEGDEKIYVDGEAFPSHFGTGTEDYYGYAWCLPQTFNTPFIAQPTGAGNDKTGNTINTRLRLLDDIPYREGLRFDMELFSQRTGRHRFAPAVFWYARPGGSCLTPDPLAKSVLPVPRATSGLELAPAFCPIGLRVNVEAMAVAQNTGGAVSSVTSNGLGLSSENCVRWMTNAVGSRIVFGFSATFTGECALAVRALAGPASGTVRVSVNGQTAAEGVDLHAPAVAPVSIRLGTHLLRAGVNTLAVEVTALPGERETGDFAFDCLENEGACYVSRVLPVVRERLECENTPAVVTCGTLSVSPAASGCGGGKVALWSDAQAGGEAVFTVVSGVARHVPLTAVFMCATNGATCALYVNGSLARQGVALYRAAPVVTNVYLGAHVLQQGTNEIKVLVTGGSAVSNPLHLAVGLDCFDLGSLFARTIGERTLSPLTAPGDDPDGDGLDNLAEYAFGGDPGLKDSASLFPWPIVLQGGGWVVPVLSFRRLKPVTGLPVFGTEGVDLQVDGVVYQVQEASRLSQQTEWVTTNMFGPTVVSMGPPDDDNGKTVRVRVRTLAPLSSGHAPLRFMRVNLHEP